MLVDAEDSSAKIIHESQRTAYCLPELRLLHFNDVYHIEYATSPSCSRAPKHSPYNRAGSAEPIGGIARFQSVSNFYRKSPHFANQSKLITLFSGDAFNPSLESSVTKGRHMVPFLNNLGTEAACVGVSMLAFCLLLYDFAPALAHFTVLRSCSRFVSSSPRPPTGKQMTPRVRYLTAYEIGL